MLGPLEAVPPMKYSLAMEDPDTDILAWSEQQAAALRELARARRDLSNELDLEHVAEEIEDMGRSELIAVRSYVRQILIHLIKAISAPSSESLLHWRKEVIGFHNDLLDRITPSMLSRIDMQTLWRRAVKEADAALAVHGGAIAQGMPSQCPLDIGSIADAKFDFEAAVEAMRSRIGTPTD
jgi:hypothetical protein